MPAKNYELMDKLRRELLKTGTKEVYIAPGDLAGKVGESYTKTITALYTMARDGELEIIKGDQLPNGNLKIDGFRLLKMEPKEKINGRIMDAAVKQKTTAKIQSFKDQFPHLLGYMQQKIGVEEAKKILIQHKLPPENVIFTENDLGEEAIRLLQKLEDFAAENARLRLDLEAARRDIQVLSAKKETNDDKGAEQVPVSAGSN